VSPKLPAVTSKQLAAVAQRLGFALRRQRGSHAVYVRASDNTRVVIPMHSGTTLEAQDSPRHHRDLKLTADEFQKLL